MEEIAIIGMACRFPKASTPQEFWSNILRQLNATTHFTEKELKLYGIEEGELRQSNYIKAKPCLEGVEEFDADFFGFSKREAKYLDPQIRVFLELAYHALEDACYNPQISSSQVGVFAGASTSIEWTRKILQHPTLATYSERFESLILSSKDFLSQIVSYRLNLTGPSYTLYTACSTSLAAIHLACQSLLANECSLALAGGVTIDLPLKGGYIHEPGMIHSSNGICSPFDASANGTLFGDGAGVIVLKKLKEALRDHHRIYAVIKGSHCNNDGHRKTGFIAPSLEGQQEVIETTYDRANIPVDTIEFIETHGTATKIGDIVEFEGLKRSHTQRTTPCALGSVKANIGHLHAAAGIAGIIKAVLALQNQTIPPLTHFQHLNPNIDPPPFSFPTQAKKWEASDTHPRRAAVSSFGVGGTNVHVVLEEPPSFSKKSLSLAPPYLFPLSAKSDIALKRMTRHFFDFLQSHPSIDLSSLALTLQLGRPSFAYRHIFVADSYADLLRDRHREENFEGMACCDRPFTFLFSPSPPPPSFHMAAKHIHQKCQSILKESIPERSYQKIQDLINFQIANHDDSLEYQVACFLSHLYLSQSLLMMGIKPHACFGEREGAYLAAIYTHPDQLKELFKLYLSQLNPDWIESSAPHIKELLNQHLLTKPSKLDSSMYYLFYGQPAYFIENMPLTNYTTLDPSIIFDDTQLKHLMATLWQKGITIQWDTLHKETDDFTYCALPSYPFDKQRYWIEEEIKHSSNLPETVHENSDQFNKCTLQEISHVVKNICEEILNIPSIDLEDNLFRLGGDSLQLIQIISRINHQFKVDLPLEELHLNPTMRNMIDYLIPLTVENGVSA